MSDNPVLGWHFTDGDTLRNGDGRKIVPGEILSVEGPLGMCKRGLHLSMRAIDALSYSTGNLVWRVEGIGERIVDPDKMCFRSRRAIWGYDAERVLRRFARWCTLEVAHLWAVPKVVFDWLTTGDESLFPAARAVVLSAVMSAVSGLAGDAGWRAALVVATQAPEDGASSQARGAAEMVVMNVAVTTSAGWASRHATHALAMSGEVWRAVNARHNAQLESMLIAGHEGTLDFDAPLPIPDRR